MVFQADNGTGRFSDILARTRYGIGGSFGGQRVAGVRVAEVAEDPSDFKLKYDPEDPDANEDGYVEMPNVDLVKEITDGMAASQAFSANITAFNLLKGLISKGLEIGK